MKRNKKTASSFANRTFHKMLLIINILCAVALLFSYTASFINPTKFVLPAFFGLAYPYLLLLNVLFMVIWISGLKVEALISLAVILTGFNHLSNFISIRKPKDNIENAFKIISYNTRQFKDTEQKNGSSEDKILSFFKKEHPDIICFQEFFIDKNTGKDHLYFENRLGKGYNSHIKMINKNARYQYGIATFSKHKIINRGEIILPSSSGLSIFTDIVLDSDTIRVFNNHLQSFKLKNLNYPFWEEVASFNDKTLPKVKNILTSLKKGFEQRAQQSVLIKAKINESPYPVIVLGDFNDTPTSFVYKKIRKNLNDAFVKSGCGAGFSYRGNYPSNRIDYILYDDFFTGSCFKTLKINYSDHYPICTCLSKNKGNQP